MKQQGTTLMELMVALAVVGILATLGVPAFASLMRSSRLSSFTNEMVSSLHLTRSEAIKRNSHAVMCTSATGTTCAASGGWHQGWLVFHDPNNNAELDVDESVIMARQALPEGFFLTGNSTVDKYISYAPSGATRMVSGALQMGTLKLCNESGLSGTAIQIVISSTGRPRTERITLPSCP